MKQKLLIAREKIGDPFAMYNVESIHSDGESYISTDGILRSETIVSLGNVFNRNMFTHRSYLAAQGQQGDLISGYPGGVPALFCDKGDHALFVGRLDRLKLSEIEVVCSALFRSTDAAFAIFEDIRLTETADGLTYPHQRLHYQANWRLPIMPGGTYVSSKRARNLRWCRRKLNERLGATGLTYRFGKCRPGEVAAIAAFNRDKVSAAGGNHALTDDKLKMHEQICKEIGHISCLYAGDELIAGNIVCIAGKRAFGTLTGYDRRFEKYSPGLQVILAAVSELEGMGCEEINFLWGDSNWKSSFHSNREDLTTLVVRRGNAALLSARYWRAVAPYIGHAVRAALKPHVKSILSMSRKAVWLARFRHCEPGRKIP